MLLLAAVAHLLALQRADVRRRGEKCEASARDSVIINHKAKRSPGAATAHCCSFQPGAFRSSGC